MFFNRVHETKFNNYFQLVKRKLRDEEYSLLQIPTQLSNSYLLYYIKMKMQKLYKIRTILSGDYKLCAETKKSKLCLKTKAQNITQITLVCIKLLLLLNPTILG